jgi:hypothetical protein
MDQDNTGQGRTAEAADMAEVPLVPAAAVGYLLYPWAVQLILANPPANDMPRPAPPR